MTPKQAIVTVAFVLVLGLIGCSDNTLVNSLQQNLTVCQARNQEYAQEILATQSQLSQKSEELNGTLESYKNVTNELNKTKEKLDNADNNMNFFINQWNTCLTQLNICKKSTSTASVSGDYQILSYDTLMRNSDSYTGTKVKLRGEVTQVSDISTGTYVLRVSITQGTYFWTDDIWVDYSGPRVLEKDIIDIWGTMVGLQSYTTVLGAQRTVPHIIADKVSVAVKAADR
jgi:hypothetical protein